MADPSVKQFQFLSQTLHRDPEQRIIRAKHKVMSGCIRRSRFFAGPDRAVRAACLHQAVGIALRQIRNHADAALVKRRLLLHGPDGLPGKNALLVIHDPRFAEKQPGKQFQVEIQRLFPRLVRQLIQIHGHPKRTSFCPHGNRIVKGAVRIYHRIKAFKMPFLIRIPEPGADTLFRGIHRTLQLFRNRLPLAGRGFKPDVTVCRDPFPVHQKTYATLMAFRVDILKRNHIHAVIAEIPVFLFQTETGRFAAHVHHRSLH